MGNFEYNVAEVGYNSQVGRTGNFNMKHFEDLPRLRHVYKYKIGKDLVLF